MKEFEHTTLGDLAEQLGGLIQTGPFGSQLHESDYQDEGIPVIMPKDIAGNAIDESGIARISETTAGRLKKHRVRAGDIVVPRRGDITKRAFIKKDQEGFLCGTGCIKLSFDEEKISSLYLNYYLAKSDVIGWLENNSVGSTMKNLSGRILKNLPVELPPLPTQRRIASILSAYDDLIENNLRRIKLLEELAQRTYEEWFVRFRFPGHETAIFDAETGLPEGWEMKSLTDVADFLNGFAFRPSDFEDSGKPIIKIKEMKNGVGNDTPRNNGDKVSPKYLVQPGDVLFSWSGSLEVVLWPHAEGWLNQHLFKVTPKRGINKAFVYLSLLKSLDEFNNLTTGSTLKHIKRKELDFVKVAVATPELMGEFEEMATSVQNEILNLSKQVRMLKESRDILLPKLMSGQLMLEGGG